jgi:hypothetical protein
LYQEVLTQNLVNVEDEVSSSDGDITDSETPEVVIQLGANWVHGLHDSNPWYSIVQKLQLNIHQTSPDDYPGDDVILYDSGGSSGKPSFEPVSNESYKRVLLRYAWITDNISATCSEADIALSDAFKLSITASEDPSLPFGPCSDLDRRCLNWCFDRIGIDSGLDLDKVSMRYYDNTESEGEYGEGLVKGGFYQLFQHLVNEISDSLNVKYEHVVKSIVTDTALDEVTVTCENGAVFVVDACLVTVPVGVLQSGSIEFVPRPPQLERLCKLQFGLMNLVWLWYPEQFWPSGYNFFGVARDENAPSTFSTFLVPPMSDQYGVKQNIIMCQTFGEFAEKIETMSNKEIADHATKVLRSIFGENVPDACGCLHSSWKSEPFSRGSYSCAPPVNTSSAYTEEWSSDSGSSCVFFAGEATHQMHQGSANGAYITGVREATKILLSFGIDKPWSESVFLH